MVAYGTNYTFICINRYNSFIVWLKYEVDGGKNKRQLESINTTNIKSYGRFALVTIWFLRTNISSTSTIFLEI